MEFSQRPVTARIGAVLLLISFIAAFVGTVSPSWYKFGNTFGGIWLKVDVTQDNVKINVYPVAYRTAWHEAVTGLAPIGVVCLFVSTCAAFGATRRRIGAPLGIFGGLMVVISVVLYAVYRSSPGSPDWGFYMSGVSGGLGVIGAVLLIPGQYQNAYTAY